MVEIWKDIPNWEGLYQVSNLGNVKSLSRVMTKNGKYPYISKERILTPNKNSKGYYKVTFRKDNLSYTKMVHQLVAKSFLNHKPNLFELVVDHINDNPLDNRVENLQVITARENAHKTQGKYSSKYKGVYWHKRNKKWRSAIQINGRVKYLGDFDCELKAHLVYVNKVKQIS